jgi:nitroreductase
MTDQPPTPGTAARPRLPAPASELIGRRYSCRAYLERPISDEDKARLNEFMASRTVGPLGSQARFGLIAAAADDRRALRRLGTYGFIKGATGFIVGAVQRAPKDLEDYGDLLEEVILYATAVGLGTCWLGGTFTRSTFVRRFGGLRRGETMPAVVSTGYIGDDGTERIREREEGDRRLPPAGLFFEGEWGTPLAAAGAGRYAAALEAVRMAPSATNKQPWRIVRTASPDCTAGGHGPGGGHDWHLYLVRTKGYGKGSAVFTALRIADLQRVDLGIAMCHFELVAREAGLKGSWVVADPGLSLPGPGIEYTATWREAG